MGVIYIIENVINEKVYVGKASGYGLNRIQSHLYSLWKGKHHNRELQRDFYEYGIDNFRWNIIDTCPDNMAEELETKYIQVLENNTYLYNVMKVNNVE